MKNPNKLLMLAALTALVVGCGGGGGGGDAPPAPPPSGGTPPPPPPVVVAPQLKLLAGSTGGAGNVDGPASVARLDQPSAVVVAGDGSRYVAEAGNHTIRRIAPDGTVSTLAGQSGQPGSADGKGAEAAFNKPLGLALDGAGGLFVADTGNHTIRRVNLADGTVSTVAGKAGQTGTANGAGTDARFNAPVALAVGNGQLFIADWANHAIRVLRADGSVATHAGLAGEPGDAALLKLQADARFRFPNGLAYRASDNLLFVIDGNNCVIRSVETQPLGRVRVVAGKIGDGSSGQSDQCGVLDSVEPLEATLATGVGTNPTLQRAVPLVVNASGGLVFAQPVSGTKHLRSLTLDGGVFSLSGSANGNGPVDGPLLTATFARITGLAVHADGTLVAADQGNHLLRRIDLAAKVVSTEAGQRPAEGGLVDGPGAVARFRSPLFSLSLRADGSVFVRDDFQERLISPTGEVSTSGGSLAASAFVIGETLNGLRYESSLTQLRGVRNGSVQFTVQGATNGAPVSDGPATAAGLANVGSVGLVLGMAIDSQGNAVFADAAAFAVRRVSQTGVVTRVAGSYAEQGADFGDALDDATFDTPIDVAVAANDDIYVLDAGNRRISKIAPVNGRNMVSSVLANLDDPRAIAIDEAGNLYVAEGTLNVIKRIRPNGEVTVIAGQPGVKGFVPGALPGVLSMRPPQGSLSSPGRVLDLQVRNDRLVMTMERGLVEISPLPK